MRKIRGIRDRIPPGHVLGRSSGGQGPVELLDLRRLVAGLRVAPASTGGSGGGGGGGATFSGIRRTGVGPALLAATTTTLTWSTSDYNEGGWTYSAGEFTVPSGVSKIDINANIQGASVADQLVLTLEVAVDGSTYAYVGAADTDTAGTDSVSASALGINVTGGVSKVRVRAFSTNAQTLGQGNISIKAAVTAAASSIELIDEIEGDGSATSITFSSLPTNYNHLIVRYQGRLAGAVTISSIGLRMNGDTGNNYDRTFLQSVGATADAFPAVAQSSIYIGNLPGASAPAGTAGYRELIFPDYTNTVFHKMVDHHGGFKAAATTSDLYTEQGTGWWRNTAALTSITIFAGSAFVAGSKFRLYGSP